MAYIHTLKPFSQDYGLAFYTTHVVCVNFIRELRNLQFNVNPERQIFEKLFNGRFIYSHSFWRNSAEKESVSYLLPKCCIRQNIFCIMRYTFSFMSELCLSCHLMNLIQCAPRFDIICIQHLTKPTHFWS